LNSISGYAAVFNTIVHVGDFLEQVDRGAFAATLKSGRGVVLLLGHNQSGLPLASTSAGTLRLEEDGRGLRFAADLPDSPSGRDLAEAIRRGDLRGMSFGFGVKRDRWSADSSGRTVRSLLEVDLFEVSAVAFPAYPSTSVSIATPATPPTTRGVKHPFGIQPADRWRWEAVQSRLLALEREKAARASRERLHASTRR
jgi:HK97 family phage prohead protease